MVHRAFRVVCITHMRDIKVPLPEESPLETHSYFTQRNELFAKVLVAFI